MKWLIPFPFVVSVWIWDWASSLISFYGSQSLKLKETKMEKKAIYLRGKKGTCTPGNDKCFNIAFNFERIANGE